MRRVVLALVLVPACLNPTTDLSTATTATTGESTTTGDSTTTTGDSTSSSEESSTSSETSSSSGEPPVCDDDPACGPDEDVNKCPEQCNVCGDGVVYGAEGCDNGTNRDAAYSETAPGPEACAPGCVAVEFCGDAMQNGPEACDAGGVQTDTCEADCRTASCGDGTVNTLAGETCDDGNMTEGDGCSAACLPERRVFATSVEFYGDLNYIENNPEMLAGIPLADVRCNQLAMTAGLPAVFKAWLSDSDMSPVDRFDTTFIGLYRLVSPDFPIVATGWQDLTDGSLAHAIDADEAGTPLLGNVLTNTAPDGTSASDQHCTGFTKNDNTSTIFGQSTTIDATWTSLGASFCSFSYRLYCFEDP